MIQLCSVCRWFTVDTEDPLENKIKERHELKHTPHKTASERDGHIITQSNLVGTVEWIDV